jgi:outer membrane murein-binding lipoprotein Lpp
MIMGFDLGGIFKSLVNPMTLVQLATGPAGWASLAMQTLMSTVGKEIIQQLGKQLGLPDSVISLAQNAFTAATGNPGAANLNQAISGVSDATGLMGAAAGQFQREAKNQVQDFIQQQVQKSMEKLNEELGETVGNRKSGKDGKGKVVIPAGASVLMRIALLLGDAMDKKVDRMATIAQDLSNLGEVKGDKESSAYQKLSAEMNALGQEMKIVGEALNNTLKSIGEASSTLARKQ